MVLLLFCIIYFQKYSASNKKLHSSKKYKLLESVSNTSFKIISEMAQPCAQEQSLWLSNLSHDGIVILEIMSRMKDSVLFRQTQDWHLPRHITKRKSLSWPSHIIIKYSCPNKHTVIIMEIQGKKSQLIELRKATCDLKKNWTEILEERRSSKDQKTELAAWITD